MHQHLRCHCGDSPSHHWAVRFWPMQRLAAMVWQSGLLVVQMRAHPLLPPLGRHGEAAAVAPAHRPRSLPGQSICREADLHQSRRECHGSQCGLLPRMGRKCSFKFKSRLTLKQVKIVETDGQEWCSLISQRQPSTPSTQVRKSAAQDVLFPPQWIHCGELLQRLAQQLQHHLCHGQ